jgi:hypothetical protein
MATVSIEIAGMKSLVESVEKALEAVPSDQSAVRTQLDRVMLSTQPVQPADHVVAWMQGQIPGLRRRLALAVAIEASKPGLQSFVQFDESLVSTRSPAEAADLADEIADKIEKSDTELDSDLLAVLEDNSVDPYFASALAKRLSPEELAQFVKGMASRRDVLASDSMRDPDALPAFDDQYGRWLDGLGRTLGIATMQKGADLALPDDYTEQWLAQMTDVETGVPGDASALALIVSRGTWSTDFTVDLTKGLWDYEKAVDLPGMWQRDAYPSLGGGYVGAVEPGGQQAYDPLALVLKAVGRDQDAALELFARGDKVTVQVDGHDQTSTAFLKYLLTERRWPVDDGQGAKEAIVAGMTPKLGGSVDSALVAQYANAMIAYKQAEIEARADDGGNWFSDIGHMVLDGLGMVPVVGEPVDAINGIWYYAEGNVLDGSLSMASCIPVLGWFSTGGKWARRGARALDAAKLVGRDGKPLDEMLESVQLLARADDIEAGVFRFDDLEAFNRAANNPHPGVTYQYKDLTWSTDELGRTSLVSGKPTLDSPGRDTGLQRDIGKGPDARDSDVGFHLIGDSLGGPTNRLNVLPGNGKPIDDGLANLNQGEYAKMERALRGALRDGGDVRIELTPVYPSGSVTTRPDRFVVDTWVNGRHEPYEFENK